LWQVPFNNGYVFGKITQHLTSELNIPDFTIFRRVPPVPLLTQLDESEARPQRGTRTDSPKFYNNHKGNPYLPIDISPIGARDGDDIVTK
jgi:hypothetical protein